MKNLRLFLSAFVVFAVVGSALAFNTHKVGAGSIFCVDNGTTCSDKRNFSPLSTGDVDDVCNGPEFIQTTNNCIEATGPYVETGE